ncbi:MAG: alpha/beta hydrolase [Pseudomonadota bacterium]
MPRLPHVPPARLAMLRGFFAMTQALSAALAASAAFHLFLRTFRHPLRAADAALLAHARSRRIQAGVDSIQLHEWIGPGPTAVILHGWGSSAARFALLAQALAARGWRVLVFDAPGHGASSGKSSSLPQFMAALDAVIGGCGVPRALIGHSLGALAIACRHKDGPPPWAGTLDSVVLVSMPQWRRRPAAQVHRRARSFRSHRAAPAGALSARASTLNHATTRPCPEPATSRPASCWSTTATTTSCPAPTAPRCFHNCRARD